MNTSTIAPEAPSAATSASGSVAEAFARKRAAAAVIAGGAHDNNPLVKGLNPQQALAVTMADESAIILAGAGSGKTSVLTRRIAWLLEENRATPNSVLAVTFTNKAAKEMRERLGKIVETPVKDMWINTFHGLCHKMLRENAALAGLPQSFSIMDDDDQLAMVKRIIKDDGIELPEDVDAKKLHKFINKQKEAGFRAGQVPTRDDDFERFASGFYGSYEARCIKEGVVDFAELMLRVYELLNTSEEFLGKYQGRFSHIHVDEFQDTNAMQYSWLKKMMGDKGTIFAVGDDDQSIYSFRGSKPENMTTFVDEIAMGQIIRLEQNYRSTGAILSAANALIEKNDGRMGKNLWTSADEGKKMSVLKFDNDWDESDQIAKILKGKIAEGVEPDQIAILYRSNFQSRSYEKSLMAHGVPYAIYGGTRFYERMEVKNVLAYMRLATNLGDDGAFRRVINFPARGIGESSVDQISEIARRNDIPMLEAGATLMEGKLKEKVEGFVEVLGGLFEAINTMTLPDYIDHVIQSSGLLAHYNKKEEDKERAENIMEMVTAAHRFCEETTIPDAISRPAVELVDEFLASASLESNSELAKDGDTNLGVSKKKAVTLMTVHAAKGLEFNTVVLGGAEDGIFPVDRAIDEGNESEERRLMYVLITRAQKDLLVSHCKKRMVYGQIKDLGPSRFLAEIPDDLKRSHEYPSTRPAFTNPQGSGGWKGNGGANKWAEKKPAEPSAATRPRFRP